MATFADLERQIRDLDQRIKDLGGTGFADVNAEINNLGGNISKAAKLVNDLTYEVRILEGIFGNIARSVEKLVDGLGATQSAADKIVDSYDELDSLARKLNYHKKEGGTLDSVELKSISKKVKAEIEILKYELSQARVTGLNLQMQQELTKALDQRTGYLTRLNELAEELYETEKNIEKTLGVTGAFFNGIQKTLAKIGIDSKYFKQMNADLREAAKSGNSFLVLGTGIKGIFSGVATALKDPLVQLSLIIAAFKFVIDIANEFNKRTREISKSLGLITEESHILNENFSKIAGNTSDILLNQENLKTAFLSLNDAFGTSVMFSDQVLKNNIDLTTRLGLNNEEAARFEQLAQLTGQDAVGIVNAIGKQTPRLLNNKKIIQEVAKVNGQLFAQYKGSPDLIAKAVIQTQKLGLTLQDAKKASNSLLNFEESITAELEAELLTGRDLNLEKARYLALMGDSAGAAEELMRNVGSLNDFQNLNVIQQNALAKAIGMTSDELVDTLIKKEQLNNLDKASRIELEKQMKAYRENGEYEKAAELEKLTLRNKNFDVAKMELDNQEKFENTIKKIKGQFVSLVEGPLGKMSQTVLDMLSNITKIPGIKYILPVAGTIGMGAAIMTLFHGVTRMVTGIQKVFVVNQMPGGPGGGPGPGGPGGGGKMGGFGRAAGRLAAGVAVAQTLKDQYDFLSDKRTTNTGIGGYLESLGGSGMQILDTVSMGAISGTANAFGGSGVFIPGMDIDDIANARAIFHASGRDPDNSRTPMSTDNKQLIQDILGNPGAYPEGIVQQAQGVNIEELANGGVVLKGGLAKVDTGEAYLGTNSLKILENMLNKLDMLNNTIANKNYNPVISISGVKLNEGLSTEILK
jgi:hypothetical protein